MPNDTSWMRPFTKKVGVPRTPNRSIDPFQARLNHSLLLKNREISDNPRHNTRPFLRLCGRKENKFPLYPPAPREYLCWVQNVEVFRRRLTPQIL